MSTEYPFAKLIRRQLKHDERIARAHGGVLPAMWLERGFVVRVASWLGDRWGGGPLWEVTELRFDPTYGTGTKFGFVEIYMRRNNGSFTEVFDVFRSQHDLIELVRPRIATPAQWRARCG